MADFETLDLQVLISLKIWDVGSTGELWAFVTFNRVGNTENETNCQLCSDVYKLIHIFMTTEEEKYFKFNQTY